ncbi:butyrophilin subfamily 1 member A1-like [Acipenser oxyrinchus oxyrinchus]|uniref:Butyrophilin subfamily 1 member A1-like n=1 Tax=Acipenser oxyrinchus oxyrinchus TaxID=40147 RepID=A0AAD8CQP8_ACIOX|nr:butyrophilin subfamily 1 member A1-like [Acipenser oxyrinchus oxyrinchus]
MLLPLLIQWISYYLLKNIATIQKSVEWIDYYLLPRTLAKNDKLEKDGIPGRTCLIVLSLLPAVSSQGGWRVVGSDQPVIADPGDDVILPCHISPRVSAVDMERGDISLRLRNLRPSDRGVYTCYADDGSQYEEGQTEVIVAALGTQPSISMDSTHREQTRLVCRSEGGTLNLKSKTPKPDWESKLHISSDFSQESLDGWWLSS